jgi:hypothetical protein
LRFTWLSTSVLCLAVLAACMKKQSSGWSTSELQALPSQVRLLTKPPLLMSANLIRYERDIALRIFDGWAALILKTQKNHPNSPLNQLRRIFNPDHLTSIDMSSAIAIAKVEGSGTHGELSREKKPQDIIYHALWSRIADAAGVMQYPRSSRHMKHYLANSGTTLLYPAAETDQILASDRSTPEDVHDPVGVQLEIEYLREKLISLGFQFNDEELQIIAQMSRDERMFYVARLKLRIALADYSTQNQIQSPEELKTRLDHLKDRTLPMKKYTEEGAWQLFRPFTSAHQMISSKHNSDMYFSFGSYTATHFVAPLSVNTNQDNIRLVFSQWVHIFDKYNWDNGKFVTLLSSWCWRLDSPYCGNIEELTSINVNDKSLGRLHKLGIAKEYEIHGDSTVKTFEESLSFKELKDPSKVTRWRALISILYPSTSMEADE